MKNYQNRLDKLEQKIILSQRAEIDDEDFSKLLHVISDEDLSLFCHSKGEVLTKNVKEMLLKYKTEIDTYQMSRLEKLQATFYRDELRLLSNDKLEEIKNKTDRGHEILDNILDRWEEKLAILNAS